MFYKQLTEQEVQEFCNRFGVFVAVDFPYMDIDDNEIPKRAYWFEQEPKQHETWWNSENGASGELPFRILSTRPWTEQLWRPQI